MGKVRVSGLFNSSSVTSGGGVNFMIQADEISTIIVRSCRLNFYSSANEKAQSLANEMLNS